MSKWRKLFEWISQQLTDSATISHCWQVDGPTHFRTFNRIRKLLPGAQGNYKIDPGRRSVSTTYGILVKKLKKEREAAAEADAAATGWWTKARGRRAIILFSRLQLVDFFCTCVSFLSASSIFHVFKYLIVYWELSVRPSTLSHVFPFCLAIVAVNTYSHYNMYHLPTQVFSYM